MRPVCSVCVYSLSVPSRVFVLHVFSVCMCGMYVLNAPPYLKILELFICLFSFCGGTAPHS